MFLPPTGRPSPLADCRLLNQTLPSIKIGCQEGFDGGLPQTFQLEVYENDELKTKVSNSKPIFEIAHVTSGLPVKVYIYAQVFGNISDVPSHKVISTYKWELFAEF